MESLRIFESTEFGKIRTATDKNGEALFCLGDICKCLNLSNPTIVAKRLEGKELPKLNLGGRSGETLFVTESGLYATILQSRKADAKRFRVWVTSEVLPSIRKNGMYISDTKADEILGNPDYFIKLLQAYRDQKKEIDELKYKVDEDEPYTQLGKSVVQYGDDVYMAQVANVLRQNGVNVGAKRLFEMLRNNKLICKSGKENRPTQRAMEMGLFRVVEHEIDTNFGKRVYRTTMVTPKGQQYIVNKYMTTKA